MEEYLKNLRVDTVDYGEIKLANGLENLLGKYVDTLAKAAAGGTTVKKCNFIVILGGRDGEPSDLFSYRHLIMHNPSRFAERELTDVEKVLVSIAQRLDEGVYPEDQVHLVTVTKNVHHHSTRCAVGHTILPDKQRR